MSEKRCVIILTEYPIAKYESSADNKFVFIYVGYFGNFVVIVALMNQSTKPSLIYDNRLNCTKRILLMEKI